MFSFILFGCSSSRKARSMKESEITSKNSMEAIVRNNLSNNDFYIQKAEINVIQDNISVRMVADIKYKKSDSLLITIRSRTGIEAGRAFISKDTLIIKDRFNKKLFIGKPDALGLKYGVDPLFIFTVLGDIVVEEKDKTSSIECIRGEFRKEYEIHQRKVEYIIDCQYKKIKQAYFEGDITTGNITIELSDFINENGIIYPGRVEINDDLKSLRIVIEIKKILLPWAGKLGSVVNQGYKVIKIR
jgi:hypothetical protein